MDYSSSYCNWWSLRDERDVQTLEPFCGTGCYGDTSFEFISKYLNMCVFIYCYLLANRRTLILICEYISKCSELKLIRDLNVMKILWSRSQSTKWTFGGVSSNSVQSVPEMLCSCWNGQTGEHRIILLSILGIRLHYIKCIMWLLWMHSIESQRQYNSHDVLWIPVVLLIRLLLREQ